jgi:hypothetical protein
MTQIKKDDLASGSAKRPKLGPHDASSSQAQEQTQITVVIP